MAESGDDSFNSSRAEVFEALGHPTRIRILQAVSERPLPFSELKHAVGLESNGLLSFHLGRLSGLVKLNEQGSYFVTDEGREALRIIGPSKEAAERGGRKKLSLSVPYGKVLIAVLLIGIIVLSSVAVIQQQQMGNTSRNDDGSIASLQAVLSSDSAQAKALNSTVATLNSRITALNSTIATLSSNQSALISQRQALELQVSSLDLRVSQLQNASSQLQMELSAIEQVEKVIVLPMYVNQTMTIPANTTVPLNQQLNGHNGTIIWLSDRGCYSAGSRGGLVGNQYTVNILLNSRSLPLTSLVTTIGPSPFAIVFQNIGTASVQCTFSMFWVYQTAFSSPTG
ncbi:MAG: helix-turn-helix domain-containing protein [Nitrososphaerales archaeon]|jgi:DNA-binding transcriptional ArsR family regulator